ncbi:ankyrin repeat domain-containing protein, partial [Verrucomicrobia bacterium]|nr:ankyrin repeat domain-containing protein [Verrucomicrobiota bacterium]
ENISVIKKYFADGGDANKRDPEGKMTLLLHAIYIENKTIVKILIENGADINDKDKNGVTPLSFALTKEIAELLIDKGADINAKCDDGDTPLHSAAYNGRKEIAELLIDKGADINAKGTIGWTPLHLAVQQGRKEVVELLIAKGADVNAKMKNGITPLDWAVDKDYTEIAYLLSTHGGTTSDIKYNIEKAIKQQDVRFLRSYINNGGECELEDGTDLISFSVEENKVKASGLLIDNYPERFIQIAGDLLFGRVQGIPNRGAAGTLEIIQLLIMKGAPVNKKCENASYYARNFFTGYSKYPLDNAKRPEVYELLKSHGAKSFSQLEPMKAFKYIMGVD